MNKPTVFFSHSSKDKDLVLLIKNKVENITKKTINIFMSSDGQSIPFGTNWIHKIEDGLNESKIMFVFVTNNSIDSGWIYFESGFAYSKNIKVIPIGIGVDIGKISAPLSLLQGFNVTSSGAVYFEFNSSTNSGYNSLVNSYGVLPPKISLGTLLMLSSICFTCSTVNDSNEVFLGK